MSITSPSHTSLAWDGVRLEAALIADANSRAGLTTIAGVDRVAAQAALFAVADHPVLGEDVFAWKNGVALVQKKDGSAVPASSGACAISAR